MVNHAHTNFRFDTFRATHELGLAMDCLARVAHELGCEVAGAVFPLFNYLCVQILFLNIAKGTGNC